MTTQTIDVEGLPEGWMAVAYRVPIKDVDHFYNRGVVSFCIWDEDEDWLIVEKIQPRRIALEETGEERAYPINGYMYGYIDGAGFVKYKILREVKETDIPLTNEDDNVKMNCGLKVLTENDIEAVALNDAGCAVLDRFYEITGHETTYEMRRLVKPLLRVGIIKYINQVKETDEPKLSLSVDAIDEDNSRNPIK